MKLIRAETPVTLLYTRTERMADNVVHVVGIAASLTALVALLAYVAPRHDASTAASLAIYGVASAAVFCFSALYHMSRAPAWKPTLRRLDHAAIFVKIAGTYTPFAAISIGGGLGAGLLSAAWAIAAVGVPLSLFAPERLGRFAVWLYLAQGWMMVLVIGPLIEILPPDSLALLVAGGLLYTVGVVFHLWERLLFHNAIWHAFVLAASICMFAAVLHGMPTPRA